ncbi:MAG: D-2-hydroxyacid dehydrogenase [Armatimonadetes bacterium]|nr:D-2-hydroxyacid dehydrogenase [Armatimonadota bacterium]MDW8121612.1 D-2-hydroxyacid dehydrogenase [Armatimonadota bacterium]
MTREAVGRKLLITHELTLEQLEEVRQILGEGTVVYTRDKEEAIREGETADLALLGAYVSEVLTRGKALKWVHIPWAGVDGVWEPVRQSPAIITCGKGVYDAPMADHVFALLLALTRQIPTFILHKETKTWRRDWNGLTDLRGRVMGIVGVGNVGREVAFRAKAFGMTVLGVKKRQARLSDLPVDGLYLGYEGLRMILPDCDVIVITAALTPSTRYLFSHNEFAAMKRGSYFINVARGAIVDEPALINALQSGHLAGAGLDVFEKEPLPEDSLLWTLPNVILTPHIGGISDRTRERQFEQFKENLRLFLSGQPLLGLVDKEEGY